MHDCVHAFGTGGVGGLKVHISRWDGGKPQLSRRREHAEVETTS